MDTPLINAAYQEKERRSAYYFQKFGEMKELLDKSVVQKHIWNVEFEEVKHFFSSVCEGAMEVVKNDYHKTFPTIEYHQLEFEHEVGYMFSPHLAGSYIRKIEGWLRRKRIIDNPQLQQLLSTFGEVASLYAQLNSVKPFIEKGRKPNPDAVEPDLSHTGTCAICNRTIKLGPGNVMVDHGFQISSGFGNYFGMRQGHCFGVKYQPAELSCKANENFLIYLEQLLKGYETRLAELQTGTAKLAIHEKQTGIKRPVLIWIDPSDSRYVRELMYAVSQVESDIKHAKRDIETQEMIIKNWTAKPLRFGGYEKG
jgi:hypothetical protein